MTTQVSDMVERLRRSHGTGDLHLEAADIIAELVEALRGADKLIDNLWESVPWGQTFNLDILSLNETPPKIKHVLAKVGGNA